MAESLPSHAVAVIGGATAGAEIASKLAGRGLEVAVFEMNPRPFGKIEDGLPRWHSALREKEFQTIRQKLGTPGVSLIPNTKIGRDIGFPELVRDFGFSAVVLASGAWRDRPLPIDGADQFVDRGLFYQNRFIIAFNHLDDPTYFGPKYKYQDGALVLGGGLASIDVCKLLMIETVRAALERRGIATDMEEVERVGLPGTLERYRLDLEALDLRGCTLFYRRGPEDMPLMSAPEDASEDKLAKVRAARLKLLTKAREKYLFNFEPYAAPNGLLSEQGRLVGLRFQRMGIADGKLRPTGEVFERRAPYVVSSIGSIPEPIAGIPMNGELLPFTDPLLGKIAGYPNVFSAGNVVTGKGNIIASRRHATEVASTLIERFLGLGGHQGEERLLEPIEAAAAAQAESLAEAIAHLPPIEPSALRRVRDRVRARQAMVGFSSFEQWMARVAPPRPA